MKMNSCESVKIEQNSCLEKDLSPANQSLWSLAIQRARFVYQNQLGHDLSYGDLVKTLLHEVNGLLIEVKNLLRTIQIPDADLNESASNKIDSLVEAILSYANQTELKINSDVFQEDSLFSPFEEVLEIPRESQVKQEYIDDILAEDFIDYEDINEKTEKEKPTAPKKKRSGKRSKRKYACEKCGRSWCHRSGLSYHSRKGKCVQEQQWIRWTRGRPLCIHPDCSGKEFSNAALMNHIIEVHATQETSIVQCPECPQRFPMLAVLRYHQEIVHQAYKEICTICGAQVRDMRKHKWVHTSEKPFQCDKCNYRCNRPSVLKRHMYTHSEDASEGRVHKCDLCEKAFYGNRELKEHRLTHSKIKPYQCKVCNDVFSNYSGHRQHMMRAHGQKLNCDICGKDSYSTRGLNIHKRDHHGVPI